MTITWKMWVNTRYLSIFHIGGGFYYLKYQLKDILENPSFFLKDELITTSEVLLSSLYKSEICVKEFLCLMKQGL